MNIITLTTDLGLQDFYAAALKGAILTVCPETTIVDISHEISKHDIFQAAFILKNSFHHFPQGTVHIVSVNPGSVSGNTHLIINEQGHLFIGPDNGLFSLVFDAIPEKLYEINVKKESMYQPFPARDLYARIACHLVKGGKPEVVGKKIDKWQERTLIQPVVEPNQIKGYVIYIDSYENLITNITFQQFDLCCQNRKFTIFCRKAEYEIEEISASYNDVPEGEKFAIFNSAGYLEIGINKGKASGLLGLNHGDMVRVEFRP